MKHLFYLCLLALQISTGCLFAQNIGINSTGALPDSSALLDMTSTSKGVLTPRMTTTQRNAITLPANGLLLYNTTSSLFEVNTGSTSTPTWVTLINSTSSRNNFVLVKSAADFPAPISGVITLVSGTLYEINGTINLTNKIDPNGAYIQGQDAVNDKLVYTPSFGELFTGTHGGSLNKLSLTASAAGAKLFNIDAAGANVNLVIQSCYIVGCDNIGTIKGIGGTIYLETVAYFYNNNGITYQNSSNVILSNTVWDNSNRNTYEKFIGAFNIIQIHGGDRLTLSGNSATALNVSGISTLVAGSIKVVIFTGTGTYKTGTFSSAWEVESTGLETEKDDVASGNLYISTATPTVIAIKNTKYKVEGTTTSANLFRVTSPSNNKLTYTGTKTRKFMALVCLSAIYNGSSSDFISFSFYLAKNGVLLPESKQSTLLLNNATPVSLSISCNVVLNPNDYVEVYVVNNTDATDVIVQTLNFSIN